MTQRPKPFPAEDLDEDAQQVLERTWQSPSGFWGWLSNVHHQAIGTRFIVTAFVFFLLGGILAALMRLQLARPESHLLGPDLYKQIFTMHGTTMMFLFAVPIMQGMGVYLVPLMVGTRNIAFPRLNNFSYFVYLFGGIMLYVAFLLNIGPDVGWFSYVPLAGPEYSPGKRADFWAQMITFTELSSLAVAVQLIVTIFQLRAPGMSLNRVPLFVWSILVTSFIIVFAMPAVMLASTMLIMDRLVGTYFFNPAEGGDALLWQHLFWFFGHPEVYIIFIPALGMVSSIIATFSRRKMFGYTALALSVLVFLGNVLWSRRHGLIAGDNPWQAGTLEWATSSPPPGYNFLYLPTVSGREPLWEQAADQPVVTGLRHDIPEVLVTRVLDAVPDHRTKMPDASIWPFITAVAITGLFIGSIFTPWAVPIGAGPVAVGLLGWLWPTEKDHQEQLVLEERP
jgi:heme/copper-type cytochrome/quinol oxidase subunit 1